MSKIIVALDFDKKTLAYDFIAKVSPNLCKLKIGKAMFTRFGPSFVKEVIDSGFDVFLDLKFHDIPAQTAQACEAAAELGVWMLNVHAAGGFAMMQTAKMALDKFKVPPKLIAVTVLTSLSQTDLTNIGIQYSLPEQVLRLAKLAESAGLDGVVCSGQEAQILRQNLTEQFCLVTPGIRLANTKVDDQKRCITPVEAMLRGVNYLVIGRPITQSIDPKKCLCEILESLEK